MDISKQFEDAFGNPPEIVAQAPGRVNLIGEHIDYSDGYVLPFAIDSVTKCAISRRDDDLIRISSAQQSNQLIESSLTQVANKVGNDWERYVLGVIWALEIKSGLDIFIDGQVPLGAGLSSSAALECSVATALNHLFVLEKTTTELARITQLAENQYVGVPCGIMDQSVSLMGKAGYALLLDCRDLSTKHIPVDFAGADLRLLIIDTRAHHALVDGGYAERRASCESVAAKLSIPSMRHLTLDVLQANREKLTDTEFIRARHAVTEIARVLDAVKALRASDFKTLGALINASHISLRDDYTVSCPELDTAVDAALAAGALGSRMVGGGFGGSAIALIQASKTSETIKAIEKAFAERKFKAPRFFTSLPSQGAEVISKK